MFTIGELSRITGLSTYTIRYYEKEKILPDPRRCNGKNRYYTEEDLNFIKFVLSLKETGMSIECLKEIVQVGCIVQNESLQREEILMRRSEILNIHLLKLKKQEEHIKKIIKATEDKLKTYETMIFESSLNKH